MPIGSASGSDLAHKKDLTMITTSPRQPTAEIYQFPSKSRPTVGGRAAKAQSVAELPALPVHEDVGGGSWYHEAAIRDAELMRKL